MAQAVPVPCSGRFTGTVVCVRGEDLLLVCLLLVERNVDQLSVRTFVVAIRRRVCLGVPALRLTVLVPLRTLRQSRVRDVALLPRFIVGRIFRSVNRFCLSRVCRNVSSASILRMVLNADAGVFTSFRVVTRDLTSSRKVLRILRMPTGNFDASFRSSGEFRHVEGSLRVHAKAGHEDRGTRRLTRPVEVLRTVALRGVLRVGHLVGLAGVVLFHFEDFRLHRDERSAVGVVNFRNLALLSSCRFVVFEGARQVSSSFPASAAGLDCRVLQWRSNVKADGVRFNVLCVRVEIRRVFGLLRRLGLVRRGVVPVLVFRLDVCVLRRDVEIAGFLISAIFGVCLCSVVFHGASFGRVLTRSIRRGRKFAAATGTNSGLCRPVTFYQSRFFRMYFAFGVRDL